MLTVRLLFLCCAGLQPYMALLEGGRQGEFFQELLDYFYYAQLKTYELRRSFPAYMR